MKYTHDDLPTIYVHMAFGHLFLVSRSDVPGAASVDLLRVGLQRSPAPKAKLEALGVHDYEDILAWIYANNLVDSEMFETCGVTGWLQNQPDFAMPSFGPVGEDITGTVWYLRPAIGQALEAKARYVNYTAADLERIFPPLHGRAA